MRNIPVIISSYSSVISSGFSTLLSSLKIPSLQIGICDPSDLMVKAAATTGSVIFFLDSSSVGADVISSIRQIASGNVIIVGIFHSALAEPIEKLFDDTVSIYSSNISVKKLVNDIVLRLNPDANATDELTPREKEIVIGVVKGLSNKEIASNLNVSVNTVMTHRRNIASKLQVHSAAGLTIYAIVSKLVSIDEIKAEML